MFLTQKCDYDPKLSAVYQSHAWHAVTITLQQPLFLAQVPSATEPDEMPLIETRILESPSAVLALIQDFEGSLTDLETTMLCPRWLSNSAEPWKIYALDAIWEATASDGQSLGWRYDAHNGEKIYEIYGSENPEGLEWKKLA